MQYFNTPFIFSTLVLFFAIITSSYQLNQHQDKQCVPTPKVVTVEQVTDPVQHAEGPHWDHKTQKLYFVDIHEQKIYHLNIKTGNLTSAYIANGPVGFVIPVQDSTNQLIAGSGRDLVLVTWDSENNFYDPNVQILTTVEPDRNDTRFNDGKADSHGGLWAGTMGQEDASGVDLNQGSLYRITSDLNPVTKISPVSISNGLAWNSADNTFYYIDTPTRQIAAYNFTADEGTIANKRIVFDFANTNISGSPDGMTIDTNGNLWIALYGGGQVISVDPVKSKLLQVIEIPANRVTSVTFGGSELDILYVTTSRFGLTEKNLNTQPRAGSVFTIKGLGVQGHPANSFFLRRKISQFYS